MNGTYFIDFLSSVRADLFHLYCIQCYSKKLHQIVKSRFCIFTGLSTVPTSHGKLIASYKRCSNTLDCSALRRVLAPVCNSKRKTAIWSTPERGWRHWNSPQRHQSGYIESNIFIEFLKNFQMHRAKISRQSCRSFSGWTFTSLYFPLRSII